MTKTIPTPLASSPDAYNIVATFSETSLAALSALQHQLSEVLGDTIFLPPSRALHSTLMEIICDRDYAPASRKQLFTDWHEQYNQIIAETIAKITPFDITFSEIEVSTRAIIVKSADTTILNTIRSTLLTKMNLPGGTKSPPDITHSTIARFRSTIDLEDVINQIKMLDINFTQNVATFKLLTDLGPLTFDPKTIEEYALRA